MGLTEDQKVELAVAYLTKTNDLKLLLYAANAIHDRINKIVEEE